MFDPANGRHTSINTQASTTVTMAPLNTSPTPDRNGRWVVTKFGTPDVMQWQAFSDTPQDTNVDPDHLSFIPAELTGDQVLIRILTAGIAGPDNIQRCGGYASHRTAEPGFTPGYDFVGDILGLGPTASSAYALEVGNPEATLELGDRVTSMCMIGAHATHTIKYAKELVKLRKDDDPVLMNALPLNFMTAFGMLFRSHADLQPGKSILIGSVSGGVGSAAAQIIKAVGLEIQMIGSCSKSKFAFVRSLGVTPVDRQSPTMVEDVRKLTKGGEGVDVAFDAVGGKDTLQISKACTKDGVGKVVMIGLMDAIKVDGSGMLIPNEKMIPEGLSRLAALDMGERAGFFSVDHNYYHAGHELRAKWREDLEGLIKKVRSGTLKPEIARLFRLSDSVAAHEMLVSGSGVTGKMEYIVDADLAKKYGM